MKTDWIIIGLLLYVIADVAPIAHGYKTGSPEARGSHEFWTFIGTGALSYGIFGNTFVATLAALTVLTVDCVAAYHRKESA